MNCVLCTCVFTATHVSSGMKFSTGGVMSVLKKFRILEHFRFQIFRLWMLNQDRAFSYAMHRCIKRLGQGLQNIAGTKYWLLNEPRRPACAGSWNHTFPPPAFNTHLGAAAWGVPLSPRPSYHAPRPRERARSRGRSGRHDAATRGSAVAPGSGAVRRAAGAAGPLAAAATGRARH